jgi:REP element-mobilizing transposase RayT
VARLARLTLADRTHHVIQRGNNRQPVFVDDADRSRMLALLAEHAQEYGCAVLLVTHDAAISARMATRVIGLSHSP